MHRLSGEDAGFLVMEQPFQPLNTMAVATLRRPAGADPITLDEVKAHLEGRLDQLPSFRWRIVAVPFGLHHPVAVRDPQFDLGFHIRERTLGPGQSLDEFFAALAERHLDRRHPLWQVTLVHGLPDGGQALICKYHHCLADGVAAMAIFSRVFSDAPTPPIPGAPLPWRPERLPGAIALMVMAIVDHLAGLARLPRLMVRTWRGSRAARRRRETAPVAVPAFTGAAPRTELNDAFTPARTYARAALSLQEVRAVKDAGGTTLNTVVLAVVSGALRGYLAERGTLPDRPLLASVPVSYEPPDAPERQAGNRFWSFTTTLATDRTDPGDRLAEIAQVTAEARAQLDALGPDVVPAWLDHVPPLVSAPGARALVDRLRNVEESVDVNVLVSNIRGPAAPWTVLGAPVEDLYIDGPPSNGVGLNIMLWSYGDRLLFGVLAFADALADPGAFSRHLEQAFAELQAAIP